jgi:hypothetical protein
MSNEIESFNRFLYLATRHCERIIRSEKKINTPFQFDEDVFIDHVDIITSRFQQLQSILGEKLLPSLLDQLGEQGSGYPFIDMFNRAIKLNIVNIEFPDWKSLRSERNRISHGEYDELEFSEQKTVVVSFIEEDVATLKKLYIHIMEYALNSSTIKKIISEDNKQYITSIIYPDGENGGIENAIKS